MQKKSSKQFMCLHFRINNNGQRQYGKNISLHLLNTNERQQRGNGGHERNGVLGVPEPATS